MEPCRAGLIVVKVLDRIIQASRFVHDRDGSISYGAHLRDATRLVPRGHQQEVAAGNHLALHLRAEAVITTNSALVLRLGPLEHITVARVAVAHYHELNAIHAILAVLHHPFHTSPEHVDALLSSEPADK